MQFSESAELGERLSGEGNNEGINFAVSNQKTKQLEERLLSAVGCQTTSAVSRFKVNLIQYILEVISVEFSYY